MVDKRSQQASGYRQRPNRNKVKSVAMTRICSNIKKWMFVFALWEFGVNAHSSVNAFVCASTYCQHTQFSDRAGEGPNATPARKHELDKRVGREGSGGGGTGQLNNGASAPTCTHSCARGESTGTVTLVSEAF